MLVKNWRARLQQDERPEPQDAPDWLRKNGVTAAALTLIAIQLVWMAVLLAHSYFRQDDFRYLDRALANGLNWSYLMWVDAGHLLPLGFAVAWAMARISLYNWPLTSLFILALMAATCLALLRMLRTVFGNRPAILIPLTVFVFSPLSLAAVTWWAVALEILPLELAIFMTVDAHVRYLRGGRFRSALAAAGWLLLGMAAMDKGVVVPLLLFALTSAFFVEGRWAVAAVRAVRRYWRAWALYGALLAGYGVVLAIRLLGSGAPAASPGAASLANFASTLVETTLVPGLLGGPWRWLSFGSVMADPPVALQQLSWAAAALVVIASCAYRRRAWRAWAILSGWVLAADIAPIAIGRLSAGGTGFATLAGLQARYVTDTAAVFALCLGLAFLPVAGETGVSRFRLPAEVPAATGRAIARSAQAVIAAVLAIFLAGSFWSLQSLERISRTGAARSYIATARAAIAQAPRGAVIVDTPTPAMIMNPYFFRPWGNTSYVIGAMARGDPARHLSWSASPYGVAPGLMIFDVQGRLRRAVIAGPSSGPPPSGQHCWGVTSAGTGIPLHASLFRWPWTVRLDYTGPAAVLALRFGESVRSGGKWAAVTLPAGAHAIYVPLAGAGNEITVRLAGTAPAVPGSAPVLGSTPVPAGIAPAMCLTGVTVGTWQPAPSGPAFPAEPVPG
jgi:hypothetical protein